MTKEEYKSLSRQAKFNLHLEDLMEQIAHHHNDWLLRMLSQSVKHGEKQNLIIPEKVRNFLVLT